MREGWQRGDGELTLDAAEVSRLVREAIPTASVTAFRPAVGGLSNTNIEVELADAPHRVLLRLYQRDRAGGAAGGRPQRPCPATGRAGGAFPPYRR